MHQESEIRDPLILGKKTYHDITREIALPVEGKANKYWWILFGLSVILFLWGIGCIAYTIGTGIGKGISLKLCASGGTINHIYRVGNAVSTGKRGYFKSF